MVGGIFLIFFEYIFQTKKKQKLQSTPRKTNMEPEKIYWKRRHIYKPPIFGVPAVCFCGEKSICFGMCHTPQPVTRPTCRIDFDFWPRSRQIMSSTSLTLRSLKRTMICLVSHLFRLFYFVCCWLLFFVSKKHCRILCFFE